MKKAHLLAAITPIFWLLSHGVPALHAQSYLAWSNAQSWPVTYTSDQKTMFADPDKDGTSNLREYVTGTLPQVYGPLHVVTVIQTGPTAQIQFTERATHSSASSYLRIKNATGTFTMPIPVTASRVTNPLNAALVDISFTLTDTVLGAELITTQTNPTLTEAANVTCEFVPGPNTVKVKWEDRSTGENHYKITRISYTAAGALLSSTTLVATAPENATSFIDTTASSLTSGNFYAYSVTPYRPHPSLPPPYLESGTSSDYAMMKYSTSASVRDSDGDFLPDNVDPDNQNPFDGMGSDSWGPFGGTFATATVRKVPGPGEFGSISAALAGTTAQFLIIDTHPGTYTDTISIPQTRNVYIRGLSLSGAGSAPNNRVILQPTGPGANLLVNRGACLCENITFKGVANSSRYLVWITGSDVFVRTTFENCIFTGQTNATFGPVGVDAGRNLFLHCTLAGNSTVSSGGYVKAQGLSCSYVMPHNLVENSIISNLGAVVDVYTPEVTNGFWFYSNLVRGQLTPEHASAFTFSDSPGLTSQLYTDLRSRSKNTGLPSRIVFDIDGESREPKRPDLGADEWVDGDYYSHPDYIADIVFNASWRDQDGDYTLNGDDVSDRWNTGTFGSLNNASLFPPVSNPAFSITYSWDSDADIVLDHWQSNIEFSGIRNGWTPFTPSFVVTANNANTSNAFDQMYRELLIGGQFEIAAIAFSDPGVTASIAGIDISAGNGIFFDGVPANGHHEVNPAFFYDLVAGPRYDLIKTPTLGDPVLELDFTEAIGVAGELRIFARSDTSAQFVEVAFWKMTGGDTTLVLNDAALEPQLRRGNSLLNYTEYSVLWVVEGVAIAPFSLP